MIIALKVVHISALTIWCTGLVLLPGLFARRRALRDAAAIEHLHRLSRFLFVQVVSPAAVVAIAAGTALIFQRDLFVNWMYAKLALVTLLVLAHLYMGSLVVSVFSTKATFGAWRQVCTAGAAISVAFATLYVVLAKPELATDSLPAWARQPGGLQSLLETIRPMP